MVTVAAPLRQRAGVKRSTRYGSSLNVAGDVEVLVNLKGHTEPAKEKDRLECELKRMSLAKLACGRWPLPNVTSSNGIGLTDVRKFPQ